MTSLQERIAEALGKALEAAAEASEQQCYAVTKDGLFSLDGYVEIPAIASSLIASLGLELEWAACRRQDMAGYKGVFHDEQTVCGSKASVERRIPQRYTNADLWTPGSRIISSWSRDVQEETSE
ncbi:hypothetical protein [Mycobacteroides immunogenum]|uniref:Uncharacterized protein n=1 Tax=Mycobacteroides immunogenum TaxID=83262 RepID=A0A7V8RXD1_9MYCO|nr:hypothetical protein [Mycobacteroides immunogenum]KPG13765.1 hypothetical protein AN909_05850 [Mycobacteroides immunogenum]KPG14243.1 hypothetical protein AN908_06545 [Mycobacteroides immunogenum]KPG14321.1 hypothetical protein AN908_07070 [Mycobacteroides immunogenum]KPG17479.1 hypothetical protein AN910_05075 [Mycobacteroides immunogenum]KPG23936.1 hypothetical protein AN911_00080 [Mycobacteroides immunogenum]